MGGLDAIANLGEVALAVADEETGLAAAAVADYDEFLGVGGGLGDVCCFGDSICGAGGCGAHCAIAISGALLPDWFAPW